MSRTALLLAVLLPLPALPADAEPPSDGARTLTTVSGAAGADFTSNQIWVGPELAVHATQRRGFAPIARFIPAFSVSDRTALLWGEGGLTVVVPSAETPDVVIRVGVLGRIQVPLVRWPLPVRVGNEGDLGLGIVPTGQALIELSWPDREGVTGSLTLRGGVGSEAFLAPCDGREAPACQTWLPGFVGSFGGRLQWPSGVHVEASGGTYNALAIGHRF